MNHYHNIRPIGRLTKTSVKIGCQYEKKSLQCLAGLKPKQTIYIEIQEMVNCLSNTDV